jgi:hypothetical protein
MASVKVIQKGIDEYNQEILPPYTMILKKFQAGA